MVLDDEEKDEDWLTKPAPAADEEEDEDEYAEDDRYSYICKVYERR